MDRGHQPRRADRPLARFVWRLSVAQHLGDQERQFQALLGVQPWVACRLVAAVQVGVGDVLCATETLGDVLTGEFDVDAARPRALGAMGSDEPADLGDDIVEVGAFVRAKITAADVYDLTATPL